MYESVLCSRNNRARPCAFIQSEMESYCRVKNRKMPWSNVSFNITERDVVNRFREARVKVVTPVTCDGYWGVG